MSIGNRVSAATLRVLEATLHREIPLSREMGVTVAGYDARGLRLRAPLAANINHKSTAFGGSLNALATLACWGLLQLAVSARFGTAVIVIQESATRYLRPVCHDFEAVCPMPAAKNLARLETMLGRRGVGRIPLVAHIEEAGEPAVAFAGRFVVYATATNIPADRGH